jgi:hypothetical protein
LQRSRESSLVRDATTGEHRHLPTESLTTVDGTSPLETAVANVPEPARRLVTAITDDRVLGLLVALEAADGLPARTVLDAEDYCESDLNGLIRELRAAGLVEPATVDGEAGYRLTGGASATIRALQSASTSG